MNWQAVVAVIAAIGLVGAYLRWSIGVVLENTMSHLVERLDERYVPAAKSSVTGAEIERRLAAMEALERPVLARRSA